MSLKRNPPEGEDAIGSSPAPTKRAKPTADGTLRSWLSLPRSPTPPSTDSIPFPVSSPPVVDRSSLFVGYAYPFRTASRSHVDTILHHLITVVHPSTVPAESIPAKFKAATHNMWAYRCLVLRDGRDGLGGPDDFVLREAEEDDGEKWGGSKVRRAMADEGAVDCLVIVSRWYGGQLLGPARFEHIFTCARSAVQAFLLAEALEPLRSRLASHDVRIAELRRELELVKAGARPAARSDRKDGTGERAERTATKGKNEYEGLTIERAQRLLVARERTIGALEKMVESEQRNHGDGEEGSNALGEAQGVRCPARSDVDVRPKPPPSLSPPLRTNQEDYEPNEDEEALLREAEQNF